MLEISSGITLTSRQNRWPPCSWPEEIYRVCLRQKAMCPTWRPRTQKTRMNLVDWTNLVHYCCKVFRQYPFSPKSISPRFCWTVLFNVWVWPMANTKHSWPLFDQILKLHYMITLTSRQNRSLPSLCPEKIRLIWLKQKAMYLTKHPRTQIRMNHSVLNGTRVLVLLTVLAISIFSQINIS